MHYETSGWGTVLSHTGQFLSGLLITVEVSAIAFICALVIGILGALARRSRFRLLRVIVGIYVEVFRNTPLLLQVFVAFFGLPALGLPLTNFQAGAVALAANAGAYLVEIIRGGLAAVPPGQFDAAHVLSLSPIDTFGRVVLPQAIRKVYPPIVNQFVQIVLGSSLLSAIALPELTGAAQTVNSETLLTMQSFGFALVLYLIVSNVISVGSNLLSRVIFHPPLPPIAKAAGNRRRWLVIPGTKKSVD
jgi:polar amino acid transport system permease protein